METNVQKEYVNYNKISYEMVARQLSRNYGINEEFVLAIMWQESRFKPDAKSNKGAYGLMQIMPNTLKDLNVPENHTWQQNIDAGIRYLKWIKSLGVNKQEHILIAYNWGIGNLRKYISGKIETLPKETQNYIIQIKKHMEKKPWITIQM